MLSLLFYQTPRSQITHTLFLLRQSLGLALLQLASINQSLHLGAPHALDLVRHRQAVELASKSSNLLSLNLALDQLNIVQHGVDLSSRGIARGKVVCVLGGALEHTLVLLEGVLGRLLGLLAGLAVSLGSNLGVGLCLFLSGLLGSSVLGGLLLGSLLLKLLLVLGGVGLLSEALDTLVAGGSVV